MPPFVQIDVTLGTISANQMVLLAIVVIVVTAVRLALLDRPGCGITLPLNH